MLSVYPDKLLLQIRPDGTLCVLDALETPTAYRPDEKQTS